MYKVLEEIEVVRERNHRFYEGLAKMTGKTITEIEADVTAPDPGADVMPQIHRLGDRTGAEFDGDNVILYDTSAYSPRRFIVITPEEMNTLSVLYADGCCPVCLEEISLNDVICDECLERAQAARR